MFRSRFYYLHEKMYYYSVLTAFFGTLLPWIDHPERPILGIELIIGFPILIVLIISVIIVFLIGKRYKRSAIIMLLSGGLCFAAALFFYFSPPSTNLGYLFSLIKRDGIGLYLTLFGTLGMILAGITALVRRGQ